jgi:hypothetical protein
VVIAEAVERPLGSIREVEAIGCFAVLDATTLLVVLEAALEDVAVTPVLDPEVPMTGPEEEDF